MGIKDLLKLFPAHHCLKLKSFKNSTIAIDAMNLIYKAALGGSKVNLLTDSDGNPTLYLSVIFRNLVNYIKNDVDVIMVFDNSVMNPDKEEELACRTVRKDKVKKDIAALKEVQTTHGDLDDDETASRAAIIEKKEKRCFSVNGPMIKNVKKMLDFFNIKWIEAPVGVEAENIASKLTRMGRADVVLSADPDNLLFGCKAMVNYDKKTKCYNLWSLAKLLKDNNITRDELIYIGVVLGCDFMKDKELFKGIGYKTVMKKLADTTAKGVELRAKLDLPRVQKAVAIFKEDLDEDTIILKHDGAVPFSDVDKLLAFKKWIVGKGFNPAGIDKTLLGVITKSASSSWRSKKDTYAN